MPDKACLDLVCFTWQKTATHVEKYFHVHHNAKGTILQAKANYMKNNMHKKKNGEGQQ